MGRDPARNVNADGCDLPALCVNAGQPLDAERVDAKVRQRPNQYCFEIANVAMDVFTVGTQADDGITNNLAQAMIRDFAAAICLEQRHVTRAELFFVE